MLSNLTLYHYWRSSSSWRVRWALEIKKIKAGYVHVDLLSGENDRQPHLSRHPLGFVPVLAAGSRYIVESVAMIEWLEENVPAPLLYPGDSLQRAHIRALVEFINADTQPIQNLGVAEMATSDPQLQMDWRRYYIRRGFEAYEKLAAPHAGRFSVGDQVTAADLFLIPQCYNAIRNGIDLKDYPLIERIYSAALATSECQAASPDKYKP